MPEQKPNNPFSPVNPPSDTPNDMDVSAAEISIAGILKLLDTPNNAPNPNGRVEVIPNRIFWTLPKEGLPNKNAGLSPNATALQSRPAVCINFQTAEERAYFIRVLEKFNPNEKLSLDLGWNNSDRPAEVTIPLKVFYLIPNLNKLTDDVISQIRNVADQFNHPSTEMEVSNPLYSSDEILPLLRSLGLEWTIRPDSTLNDSGSSVYQIELASLNPFKDQRPVTITLQSFKGTDGQYYLFAAIDTGVPLRTLPDHDLLVNSLGTLDLKDILHLIQHGILPENIEHLRPPFPSNTNASSAVACFIGTGAEIANQLQQLISAVGVALGNHLNSQLLCKSGQLSPLDVQPTQLDVLRFTTHDLQSLDDNELTKLANSLIVIGKINKFASHERELLEPLWDNLTHETRTKTIELLERLLANIYIDGNVNIPGNNFTTGGEKTKTIGEISYILKPYINGMYGRARVEVNKWMEGLRNPPEPHYPRHPAPTHLPSSTPK